MSYPGFVASPDSFTKTGHSRGAQAGAWPGPQALPTAPLSGFHGGCSTCLSFSSRLAPGVFTEWGTWAGDPKMRPVPPAAPAHMSHPPSPHRASLGAAGITWRKHASCLWSFSKMLTVTASRSLGDTSPNSPFCSLKPVFICVAGDGSPQSTLTHLCFPTCRDEALTLLSLCRESTAFTFTGTELCLHNASDNAKSNDWQRKIFC